jgi:hypothetical protein
MLLAQRDQTGNAGGLACALFGLVIFAVAIAGVWMTFEKAGKPGWASIIPIYNLIVLLEIAGKPLWWILLFLIPFVNLVVAIIVKLDVARSFGKGLGFGIGLLFFPFIFYAILGFGDARYLGPV